MASRILDSLSNSHLPLFRVNTDVGGTATIVLVTRDSHGNELTSGDHAVSFTRMSGARGGVGHILGAVDRGNGRYSAAYVGDSSGPRV